MSSEPSKNPDPGSLEVNCWRRGTPGVSHGHRDWITVEEPLELRIGGEPVATLMRTPGSDRELALGFLLTEGWITGPGDVGALALCGRAGEPPGSPAGGRSPGNVADLLPAPGARVRSPTGEARRLTVAAASCGVCGKRSIEEVLALSPLGGGGPALRVRDLVAGEVIVRLPAELRRGQSLFESTGSLHAAGLFDPGGKLLHLAEDVGRHNAVDKVIGWALLLEQLPLSGRILQVSGRVSFEIVQKAYRAGIEVIAAVSGVSSLAVELAQRAGVTLCGFVRNGSFVVYSLPERVT